MDEQAPFARLLTRRRQLWQAGLVLTVWISAAGLAAVALTAYGALDFFFTFSPAVLTVLNVLLLSAGGLALLLRLFAAGLRSPREAAARADRLLGDGRQAVLSAWELAQPARRGAADAPPLQQFLVGRSIAAARARLQRLGWRPFFPRRELLAAARRAALLLALAAAAALAHRDAARVILARIRHPSAETPPFSRYRFRIAPARLEVIYGGTLEIAAEITGAPIHAPVVLRTRQAGGQHRLVCFQESGSRYAQRLEKVLQPLECCFAVGRARSAWLPVQVRLQPQVESARLAVQPPAYSRLPERQFTAGREALAGLRGSRVTLTLTSNRPLRDGAATLQPLNAAPAPQTIAGARVGTHTLQFAWELAAAADIRVQARDVQGTAMAEPLTLRQQVTPDQPPVVSITEPAPFILSTPRARLTWRGYAEDDLGLQRVDWLRTAVGFRERLLRVGPDRPDKKFEWTRVLDLGRLGVEPGQTLECCLEARDTNPNLLGVAVSEIIRVKIISEADYARMLREQTEIEDFTARYRAAETALTDIVEALHDLDREATAGAAPARLDALRKEVLDRQRRADELYRRLVEDFQIYDLEKGLAGLAAEMRKKLADNQKLLAQAAADKAGDMAQAARLCLYNLNALAGQMQAQRQTAEEVAEVAKLMESAAEFQQLYLEQLEITRWLKRFEADTTADPRLLETLAVRQHEVAQGLAAWRANLTQRADELPAGYAELRASAQDFAAQYDAAGIPPPVNAAEQAARRRQGHAAWLSASDALDRMAKLLSRCQGGGYGGLCQNKLQFGVPDPLQPTLAQMLASLGRRKGLGKGQGEVGRASGGAGGDQNDRYWMNGYSSLDMPMYGPDRSRFASSPNGLAGRAGGHAGAGRGAGAASAGQERLPAGAASLLGGESRSRQDVPAQYRETIRRYFSTEE